MERSVFSKDSMALLTPNINLICEYSTFAASEYFQSFFDSEDRAGVCISTSFPSPLSI